MKIKESKLVNNGLEVDMPVEWDRKPTRQCTIRYDKETKRFVLSDIKTKEILYSYSKLSDLVRTTNSMYDYDDEAVEDICMITMMGGLEMEERLLISLIHFLAGRMPVSHKWWVENRESVIKDALEFEKKIRGPEKIKNLLSLFKV